MEGTRMDARANAGSISGRADYLPTPGSIGHKEAETMSNLPEWSGASVCYTRAYALLARMAKDGGGAPMPLSRPHWPCDRQSAIVRTDEMDKLIKALDAGEEEVIKGMLLQYSDWRIER